MTLQEKYSEQIILINFIKGSITTICIVDLRNIERGACPEQVKREGLGSLQRADV